MTTHVSRRGILIWAATSAALIGTKGAAFSGTVHDIEIHDFVFSPDALNVKAGDKVRWTNHDLAPHTATALDHSWDTGSLQKGESAIIEIGADQTGDFFCVLHPHMTGTLKVEP